MLTETFVLSPELRYAAIEGTAEFLNGDVDMKFQVEDEGKMFIFVEDAQAEFDDIDISVSGSAMSGLYNIIIQLFHQKIIHNITELINRSIRHDVPKALNSYLSNLPSAVRPGCLTCTHRALLYCLFFVDGLLEQFFGPVVLQHLYALIS